MELMQILHMNKGNGEASYAQNSKVQNKILTIAKPIIEEALLKLLGSNNNDMALESMGIADLGCSSGPNTFLLISEIMDVIRAKLSSGLLHPSSSSMEFRVFLNDLFSNDFNTVFMSLPAFHNKLRKDDRYKRLFGANPNLFISAVPGTFYGRLFPRNSLHFVHSSSSLHWLSQVPPSLDSTADVKFKLHLSPRLGFISSTEITHRDGYQSTMVESTVQQSRSRDLDKLLLRPGNLIGSNFEPGPGLRDDLKEYVRVLVVGAGGLGCELLKDLALSGFRELEVIDMDRIEVTNLNRQFLFRLEDVGKPKAEVAAKRVMQRVTGVNIIPHFCRIEDKELDFYSNFSIIALGLDSIEARSYINSVACSFLEYDADDKPLEETVKPMVDGGTEGFQGHARVIMPGMTPCFECTIWLFPPQVKFPLCTLAETPRTAAHCIEYAHLIKWHEVQSGETFDPDDPGHMKWVYDEATKRAELFGIPGVTLSLTQGVVKNIIPAIASTNAIISAACALETLKIASGCSKTLTNYLTYNGAQGLHTKVTEFVRDKECLVCGPGVLIELDTSVTLEKFIELLEEHPKLLLSKASIAHRGKNLYMQAPPVLEEMTRSNLSKSLYDLMGKIPKDVVHATGTTDKNDKKTSVVRKLRVAFKGVDGITDMETAAGGA